MRWALILVLAVGCAEADQVDGLGGGPPTTSSTSADASASTSGNAATQASTANASSAEGTGTGLDTCPRVRVVTENGEVLNVRPTASTAQAAIGTLRNNEIVDVVAEVQGEAIDGNDLWFSIHAEDVDGFIFSGFAECTTDMPPELNPPAGYYLPFECGKTVPVTQGNNGATSHMGRTRYAFDFAVPLNTPLLAMADGVVIHIFDETGPGDDCYNGGGSDCAALSNYVVLLHGDGTTSIYKHLNAATVAIGEFVPRMGQVGLSGTTGWSTGPHAHIMRQEDCGEGNCQSLPLAFADVPDDGVPVTGDSVTSGNCP